MSFTVQVKEEILGHGHHQAQKSELAAIIKLAGSLGLASTDLTSPSPQKMPRWPAIFMN